MDIARGLQHLHKHSIIHGNICSVRQPLVIHTIAELLTLISQANILVDDGGRARVADATVHTRAERSWRWGDADSERE